MTQIFLLGSFHFSETDIDFYTDDIQKQLWDMNNQLKKFNPDVIAVEAATREQRVVNDSYSKFHLDDLKNYSKMRNETLGNIHLFGTTVPISYKNEAIQIGYRLGKSLGINTIHAIDDDTIISPTSSEFPESIKHKMDENFKKMNYVGKDSILDRYKFYNSESWSYHSQQLYLLQNAICSGALCDNKSDWHTI